MSAKYVVGFDASPASMRAVKFAVSNAKVSGASVVIAYVLEWSPYTFLTPNELEERHKRRGEELERAKVAITDPVIDSLSAEGVSVEAVIKYGHVAETIIQVTEELEAEQIFIGRTGESNVMTRFFGSVASSLAQLSPVPCTLIP